MMQTLRQKFNRTLALSNARQRLVTNGLILLGLDPSRTTLIRRRFAAEMKARFKRLSRAIQELVVTDDVFGLSPKTPFVFMQMKEAWRFQTDANKVASYRKWLQQQVDEKILTVSAVEGKPWTAAYVESSYKKGIGRAYDDTRKFDLYEGTREQFLRDAFSAPEMLSKIELVSTRAFTQLQGVTDAMSQQMSRILADGIAAGRGPAVIARELRDNVANISKRRAEVLARTEIINAHSEGQLDSFERLGVEEVGIEAEWSTAGDDRVCEQCEAMEGEVMSVKEARGLIPLHPNCRCAWIPMTARKKEQVLETVRQDMYGEIDRMTKERGAPLDSRRAVAELYEKFGTRVDGQLVKYYRWNEYNPLEQSQILEAIKTSEFVTKNKHVLDLLRRQEGHNFVRIGSKAADPYLRSLGVAQKEINAFDKYLAKIFDKVSPRKIAVPKPIVKPKVVTPKPTAPVTPAPAGAAGTKFATAEDYRQYLLQQVEAAQDPVLVKEINRLKKEVGDRWDKWTKLPRNTNDEIAFVKQWQRKTQILDNELHVLQNQVKVSMETQRALLDEVSNKIGRCELIAGKAETEAYQEVHNSILRWIPGKRKEAYDFQYVKTSNYRRGSSSLHGSYDPGYREISMFGKSKQVYAHEFGHHVAYQLEGFMQAQSKFYRARTVGEKITELMHGIVGRKDKWARLDVYAGRVYGTGDFPEVASIGIEYLWKNPARFAKVDSEWFNMIVSQLKGIPTKPTTEMIAKIAAEKTIKEAAKIVAKEAAEKAAKKAAEVAARVKKVVKFKPQIVKGQWAEKAKWNPKLDPKLPPWAQGKGAPNPIFASRDEALKSLSKFDDNTLLKSSFSGGIDISKKGTLHAAESIRIDKLYHSIQDDVYTGALRKYLETNKFKKIKPITVIYNTNTKQYMILDGHHRAEALRAAGQKMIDVRVWKVSGLKIPKLPAPIKVPDIVGKIGKVAKTKRGVVERVAKVKKVIPKKVPAKDMTKWLTETGEGKRLKISNIKSYKFIKEYNLSQDDYGTVRSWAFGAWKQVKGADAGIAFKNVRALKHAKKVRDRFYAAMNKLPNVKKMLYRGERLGLKDIKRLQSLVKKTVELKTALSYSSLKSVAKIFAKGQVEGPKMKVAKEFISAIWKIKAKTGKNIDIIGYRGLQEHVLLKGTRIKISSISFDAKMQSWIIEGIEI